MTILFGGGFFWGDKNCQQLQTKLELLFAQRKFVKEAALIEKIAGTQCDFDRW